MTEGRCDPSAAFAEAAFVPPANDVAQFVQRSRACSPTRECWWRTTTLIS